MVEKFDSSNLRKTSDQKMVLKLLTDSLKIN